MLGHNPTQMDSYNKSTSGKGTLMANWFEERVHRENVGEGRTITRSHVPKRHQDLMESQSINLNTPNEDTKYRILGQNNFERQRPENYHYGKGHNKADTFAKTGRKQQLVEQMYLQQVTQEINERQQQQELEARKGQFTTTNREAFVPKSLDQNAIGKLVMYDQNGRTVDLENVDEELRTSNGFKERGQISDDEELKRIADISVGYEQQQPITFWRQKVEDGQFYTSKVADHRKPFAKNNEFLKQFQHYKHYKD